MTPRDRLVATIRAARAVLEAGEPDAPFLALAWDWRGLTVLIALVSVLHFWAAPAFALTPIVATRLFGRGVAGLAWTQSAMGMGFLVGGLLLGVWGGFRRRIVTVVVGISLLGVSLAVIGALPLSAFWGVVGAVFLAGVVTPVVVGSFQAIQQAVVPPDMQGSVLSLARSGMDAMSPIGMAIAGPVADALGIQLWYLLTGTVMVLMAGATLLVPTVIGLERRGAELRREADGRAHAPTCSRESGRGGAIHGVTREVLS